VRRGDFTLKSGKRSDWFIDAKQTTCRPEGMLLVQRHRPAMPPAVLIDGTLFSVGRLPRKKLRKLLEKVA